MRNQLILTLGFTAALLIASDAANAQQARTRTAATQSQLQPQTILPQTQMPPVQKCLKALDGSCVKTEIAEATRQRAAILSSVRVSYYGTPERSISRPTVRLAVAAGTRLLFKICSRAPRSWRSPLRLYRQIKSPAVADKQCHLAG